MKPADFSYLLQDTLAAISSGASRIAVVGFNPTALQLVGALSNSAAATAVAAIYNATGEDSPSSLPVLPLYKLKDSIFDAIVIADDREKEDLLLKALPFIVGTPKIILSGYGHFDFSDPIFDDEQANLLVPSLANGYPNTLIHIYQCLKNAKRRELDGAVAEFGMFKGGSTVLMARLIKRLGARWKVIGFDTFNGFPPKRSPLDMYDHPGCVFTDLSAVEQYVSAHNIEIVAGDIVETCHRLENEDLVLSFFDTDNYSPATAALGVCRERTLIGGAIVFDHFTGVDRFRYTLGERIAALPLLEDPRYFHLHGTGVFFRQA